VRNVAGATAFTGPSGRGAEGLLWLARQPLMMRVTQSGRKGPTGACLLLKCPS